MKERKSFFCVFSRDKHFLSHLNNRKVNRHVLYPFCIITLHHSLKNTKLCSHCNTISLRNVLLQILPHYIFILRLSSTSALRKMFNFLACIYGFNRDSRCTFTGYRRAVFFGNTICCFVVYIA